MEAIKLSGTPETIEQAVETLMEFYTNSLPQIREMSLKDFKASAHFGAGKFIRNTWYLWWYEGHNNDKWPKEKPALLHHFNDLGIMHADDMRSVLMACFYRSVHNRPLKIEEQVAHYKANWRKPEFADRVSG